MLFFVLKCVKTPDAAAEEDIDALKLRDWTEKDLFEATQHGADMIRRGTLFKALKMAED